MPSIVLAGATGNLGPALLQGLIDAQYQVTVLTRSAETKLPDSPLVKRAIVSYDNPESLQAALKGHDAVVCALPMDQAGPQFALIDAAIAVGVHRFIPSGFGSDSENDLQAKLPVLQGKTAVEQRLRKEAEAGKIEWMNIACGAYLDWCIGIGLFFNAKERSVQYFDGGDVRFSATKLPTVGKALAKALEPEKWEQLKNSVVVVHDGIFTQKQLVAIAQEFVGSEGWKEENVDMGVVEKDVFDAFASGNVDFNAVLKGIEVAVWGRGYGGAFDTTSNDVLGIPELTKEEVRNVVKQYC